MPDCHLYQIIVGLSSSLQPIVFVYSSPLIYLLPTSLTYDEAEPAMLQYKPKPVTSMPENDVSLFLRMGGAKG